MDLLDFVYDDGGNPISGATVNYYAGVSSGTPTPSLGSTTTNADGKWTFTGLGTGTYDVKVVYGAQVRWYKGYSIPPGSIADANVATAANIVLTKLDEGTADQTVNPATTPTTLNGRINQIVAQLDLMVGGTNWYDPPSTTLLQALRRADAVTGHKEYLTSVAVGVSSGTKAGQTTVGLGTPAFATVVGAFATIATGGLDASEYPASVDLDGLDTTDVIVHVRTAINVGATRSVTVYLQVWGT